MPIMNACPGEDALLRFLEGEIDANADARIVAHVEDCGECQDRLERPRRGRLAPGEVSTVDAMCDGPGPSSPTTNACGETADVAPGAETEEAARDDVTVDRDPDRTDPENPDDGPATRDHA